MNQERFLLLGFNCDWRFFHSIKKYNCSLGYIYVQNCFLLNTKIAIPNRIQEIATPNRTVINAE
jgi:hypothetical protein